MKELLTKTLVIISFKIFSSDGKRYVTDGGFAKYVESFRPYFKKIILVVPVRRVKNCEIGYEISLDKIEFRPLPEQVRYEQFYYNILPIHRIIDGAIDEGDIIHPRIPCQVGCYGILQARIKKKPFFISVVGNLQQEDYSWSDSFLKRTIYKIEKFLLYDVVINILMRNELAFTLGDELYGYYKKKRWNVKKTISTILDSSSLSERDDTCQNDLKTILYVGRLSPEKGIEYLIDAVGLFSNKHSICLNIVGDGPLRKKLETKVASQKLTEKIVFKGLIPFGEKLLSEYRNADIFILPSLNEAQGKVLLEAMSQSVPVIASNIGGIPSIVKNNKNGILVQSQNANAIYEAMKTLIGNSLLRQKMISNGFNFAKKHTIVEETKKIVVELCNQLKI